MMGHATSVLHLGVVGRVSVIAVVVLKDAWTDGEFLTGYIGAKLGAGEVATTGFMPKPHRHRAIEPLASQDPRNSSASRTNCSWYWKMPPCPASG
jgi:hypothetical protein